MSIILLAYTYNALSTLPKEKYYSYFFLLHSFFSSIPFSLLSLLILILFFLFPSSLSSLLPLPPLSSSPPPLLPLPPSPLLPSSLSSPSLYFIYSIGKPTFYFRESEKCLDFKPFSRILLFRESVSGNRLFILEREKRRKVKRVKKTSASKAFIDFYSSQTACLMLLKNTTLLV